MIHAKVVTEGLNLKKFLSYSCNVARLPGGPLKVAHAFPRAAAADNIGTFDPFVDIPAARPPIPPLKAQKSSGNRCFFAKGLEDRMKKNVLCTVLIIGGNC